MICNFINLLTSIIRAIIILGENMDSTLEQIVKPFKIIFIFAIVEFVILFSFFTTLYSSYDKNLFVINMNDIDMSCYYSEKYTNGILVNATSSGYNSVENRVNMIDLNDNMILNIEEFEVYYANGHRKPSVDGWYKDESFKYKKVNDSDMKLQIKRKNKIIYEGPYIKNLSSIINEKGRYFIHVYVTRENNFISSVKTHISFNVVVGGGNRE